LIFHHILWLFNFFNIFFFTVRVMDFTFTLKHFSVNFSINILNLPRKLFRIFLRVWLKIELRARVDVRLVNLNNIENVSSRLNVLPRAYSRAKLLRNHGNEHFFCFSTLRQNFLIQIRIRIIFIEVCWWSRSKVKFLMRCKICKKSFRCWIVCWDFVGLSTASHDTAGGWKMILMTN
jgi:hypothetical protein